ncbi:MAG: hypothetical protein M0Z53_13570 [Thermaerobacter sp.]|nr:hypothetical protein [Thermaerobacter sp.]
MANPCRHVVTPGVRPLGDALRLRGGRYAWPLAVGEASPRERPSANRDEVPTLAERSPS